MYRSEINPYAIGAEGYEEHIINDIGAVASKLKCQTIIIDNLSCLCNASDKSVDAGIFMMKLMTLKKKCSLSLLIIAIAHIPKRNLSSSIPQTTSPEAKALQLLRLRLRHRNERERQPPPQR